MSTLQVTATATSLRSRKSVQSFRPLVTLKNYCKTKSLAYYASTDYDNLFHVSIFRFHNICFNLCMIFQNINFPTKISLVAVPKVLFDVRHVISLKPLETEESN
jgi:hypothetical protein